MTTALLIMLVLIELARLVLQYKQGKAYKEHNENIYCTTFEVDNVEIVVDSDHIWSTMEDYGKRGYEFVQAICPYSGYGDIKTQLFFSRKKIKNFIEQ